MHIVCVEPLMVKPEIMEEMKSYYTESGHTCTLYQDRPGTQKETAVRIRDADIAVVTDLSMPRAVIEKTKHLKLIIFTSTAEGLVDAEACRERGILITHALGYSTYAAAELAFGMMISLFRHLWQANDAMHTGMYELPFIGREIHGKTIGIIGLGAVGIKVARMATTLGCKILGYDMMPIAEAFQIGVTYKKLETLFQESDIVSIHCPLTPGTKGMITYDLLARMKPDAVLINIARGSVVDTDALVQILQEGKIAGAGIDSAEEEALDPQHPLLSFDNVIITPHIGYRTHESYRRRAEKIRETIDNWLAEAN